MPGGNNVGIRYAMDSGADYVWLLNNDAVADLKPSPRLWIRRRTTCLSASQAQRSTTIMTRVGSGSREVRAKDVAFRHRGAHELTKVSLTSCTKSVLFRAAHAGSLRYYPGHRADGGGLFPLLGGHGMVRQSKREGLQGPLRAWITSMAQGLHVCRAGLF
jgi:hypothetical protein